MITKEDWDEQKQRPFNIYLKKYKIIYDHLNTVRIQVVPLVAKACKNGKRLSFKGLTREIRKICSCGKKEYAEGSLLDMMKSYLEEKGGTICLSTYRRYRVFIRMVEMFEGFIVRHISIAEIDPELIGRFCQFGKEENYTQSTISRTIEFIKTVLNHAERKGILTSVRQLEVPKVKNVKKVMILTEEEISRVAEAEIPEKLQRARDWLLISCYTGQRISDFMHFNAGQLTEIGGKQCLSFIQKKTRKEIVLPLHPEVLNILNKYGNSFPEPLDTTLYNRHIKKIAALAGISDYVKVRKRVGFRGKDMQVEKWQSMTSHIGRRSFASNFYGQIPTPLLMQATGHSTEHMFLNYINSVHYDRVVSLGNYFEQLYASRNMARP
ncbi:site-specific integrase [Chryseobacterium hagamense]|nr:site-specific integrase [Chryseobacterium hagamense]